MAGKSNRDGTPIGKSGKVLLLKTSIMCDLENAHNAAMGEIIARCASVDLRTMRSVLEAGLQTHHKGDSADDLIEEVGAQAVATAIATEFSAAMKGGRKAAG